MKNWLIWTAIDLIAHLRSFLADVSDWLYLNSNPALPEWDYNPSHEGVRGGIIKYNFLGIAKWNQN